MPESKTPADPKFIFEHAHEVWRASNRLDQIAGQLSGIDGSIPAAFLNAFSIELFLKCIVAVETNSMPPREHNLYTLFMLLSEPTRKRITVFWDWYAQGMNDKWNVEEQLINVPEQVAKLTIPRDIEGALKLGSRAFERMRYWYEKGPDDWYFFIGVLPDMLSSMILELRPEWGGLPPGWKLPDDFSKPPPMQPVPPQLQRSPELGRIVSGGSSHPDPAEKRQLRLGLSRFALVCNNIFYRRYLGQFRQETADI